MSVQLRRPATADGLFLWVLHRFAEAFEEHAIVKGGLALRLFDCPRSTTDIDYVFVPYRSKNDVVGTLRAVLGELDGAAIRVHVHSKMIRADISVDGAAIRIEANVARECASLVVPTAGMALRQGQPSRLVRVMAPELALAHKLAAWNERRLLRDFYDIYYLTTRLGAQPDLATLRGRLRQIESRLPVLRNRRSMTLAELQAELMAAANALSEVAVRDELAPILPADELAGLVPRLRSAITRLVERFAHDEQP